MKEESLRQCLKQVKYDNKPSLSGDIWNAVVARDVFMSKVKLWAYGASAVLSAMCLVFIVRDLSYQFTQSGFYEYVSLAFSDTSSVIVYWREFLSSIADSLPLIDLIPSFILMFVILVSMRNITNQFRSPLITA